MSSRGPVGPLLGRCCALLGPSGSPRGALSGHFGAILRPQSPNRGDKAIREDALLFLWFSDEFGLLGGS
eukprot:5692569-Pyramimonas_sp.AAC.1